LGEFNGKLRDELLNREVFHTLKVAQILTGWWRREFNELRPHSSLRGRPPAPHGILSPEFPLRQYASPAMVLS
jgi:transposase InsO family protein